MSRYAVNQVFLFTILFINFWVRPKGHCLSWVEVVWHFEFYATTQWDIWFGIRGHLALFCHVIWHYLGTMLWENGFPLCTCSSRAPISLGGAELLLIWNLVHTYGPLPAPSSEVCHVSLETMWQHDTSQHPASALLRLELSKRSTRKCSENPTS